MNSSILLIEDERLVAEHIATILRDAGYKKVAIASKREEALSFYSRNEVCLIISDVNLFGDHEGPRIVKELLGINHAPVIYLTAYSEQQTLEDALATAPIAYVLKPFTERQLLVTVKMALRDHFNSALPDHVQKPSSREIEIIQCLAEGHNSKEIADKLFISEHTVRTHRRNLLKKLEVGSSSELITMAIKLKWVKL